MAEQQDSPTAAVETTPTTDTPPEPLTKPKSEEEIIAAAVEQLEREEAEGKGEIGDTDEPQKPEAEPAAAEPAAESPEEVRHAQRLAELARRDRAIRQRAQELGQREEQIKAAIAQQGDKEQWKDELRKAFNDDPLGAMKSLGVDFFDSLSSTEKDESDRTVQRIADLQARIDAMEQRDKEDRERAQRQRQQNDLQAAYSAALTRIHGVISADPDNHEATIDQGQKGLTDVFRALDVMYQDAIDQGLHPGTPTDQDILRAAKVVEEVYRKEELEELQRKAKSKRLAGRLTFGDGPETKDKPTATDQTQPTPQQSTTKTLTNDLHGEVPQRRKLLTEAERMKAALAIPAPNEVD